MSGKPAGGAWRGDVLALILALGWVGAVALFTPPNPVVAPFYLAMAEEGVIGNDELVAPYAYRVVYPLLSGALARAFSLPAIQGFELTTWASLVALLYLCFALAQSLGAGARGALFAMAAVALSMGQLKQSLYYRTGLDALCQALLVLFAVAFLARRRAWALGIAWAGVLVREFALIACAVLAYDAARPRSRASAAAALGIAAASAAVFLAPRLLIPVVASEQFIDPSRDRDLLGALGAALADGKRLFNVALGTLSYLLPLWLLITPGRLRRARPRLAPHAGWLGLYTALVLLFTLFGGTDIFRFLTYLFLPQTFALAALFADEESPVGPWEIAYALAAVALHNRIFLPLPGSEAGPGAFLDALPAYASRVNAASAWRAAQIAAAVLGAVLLRRWVPSRRGPGF